MTVDLEQQPSSPAPTLHGEPVVMEDTQRHGINSTIWHGRRGLVVKILTGIMVAILVVFLADLSYVFGSTFEVGNRVSGLKILVVDYDGGQDFPTETKDVKHGVCNADYWGAIYIKKGSSDKLAAAYEGGSAAENYNPADSITYIYNSARYPTVASGYLVPNLQKVIGAARGSYYQSQQGRSALRSVNSSDPAAVEAYLNPIQGTADVIQPTNQGSRNLYNTINIVMAILGQFFYVLAMNGIYDKFGLHKNMRIRDLFIMRFINGMIFSALYALVVTGYIWAFREDWDVSGGQFALSWLTFWLFMDVNFQVLETLIGSYIPMALTPFFLLTWFMMNVGSVVFPFELTAGFYRIGYIFPAHSLWIILIQVWSGCGNSLHIGLPILFAWWVVGHVTAFFGIRKRCLDQLENLNTAEGKQQ
ncbi:Nitrosoguanidine resistance protein SNG1 [Fusarium oxysporum f. sp. cubense race 1]|uniref:Nitrosoguanidine resistance protein SNG1 n=1 Tax=Fusarium oxysporum f. sp. cubense (strain race 1) TaxID=1229664 RepID=N4UF08_FUSC1|nr:Nitrosoguanidine resistance protein SNG1 [Fusarium oxysporum f. sp. cubense race 1]